MHLADGIISSAPVLLGLNASGAMGVLVATRRSQLSASRAAWTGTLAAFVLALQALNLPIVPGASVHAIGAGLLTLAVGPARAVVAMFAVLLVQALLLADGGLTVLGINALNIAVLPVLAVELCRRLLGESQKRLMLAAVLGTTLGNVLGALSLTGALVYGAAAPTGFTSTWLLSVQGLAGLVEGALTALAIRQLHGRAPALLARSELGLTRMSLDATPGESSRGDTRRLLTLAACAMVIVLALLPLASTKPDALEYVLERVQAHR